MFIPCVLAFWYRVSESIHRLGEVLKNFPAYIEFFTKMASAIFTLLLGKLLYDQTNSLWAFATAYGGEFLIVTLIQLYAGSFADRYAPARILIAINALSVSVFLFLAMSYDVLYSVSLLIAAAMVYVFRPFYRTSLFVLVREIAAKDELKVVNGRMTSASQLGQIIGLSLTGLFLSWYSEIAVFYLMTLIYGFCFVLSLSIYRRRRFNTTAEAQEKPQQLNWHDFVDFIKSDRAFSVRLASSFSIAASLGGFYILLAPLVAAKFSDNTVWLSWLSVSYASGAILSGILMKQFHRRFQSLSSDFHLMLNQGISAVAFLCYGLFEQLLWLPVMLFCFGASTTFAAVSLASFLQSRTLNGVAGRTAAAQNILIAAGNTFVAFYCSYLFDWSFDAAALGLALLILVLMCFFFGVCRLYPESETEATRTLATE